MNVAALKSDHIPETDRLMQKVKSVSEWAAWEKVVPSCSDEAVPAKGGVYGGHEQLLTAVYGFQTYGATAPARCDVVGFGAELPPPGAILQFSPGVKGCVGVADMLGALGIVEAMEATPKKAEAAKPARLREVRSATPDLYPDLDLNRIKERVAELSAASSDSEAVSMVFRRSVQIVVHDDE
jgi:hypothetical protein